VNKAVDGWAAWRLYLIKRQQLADMRVPLVHRAQRRLLWLTVTGPGRQDASLGNQGITARSIAGMLRAGQQENLSFIL
jgi:hypothetical protein